MVLRTGRRCRCYSSTNRVTRGQGCGYMAYVYGVCRTIENGEFKIENLPSGATCQTSESSVAYVNGVSEALFKVGMCLPAGPYVSDEDVKYIVECIKEAIG